MSERQKLAVPALSLPTMIVIASGIAWKKTSVHVGLVVAMAIITGRIFEMIIA